MDVRALEDRYQERTPNSRSLFLRAAERVPGGVHGNIKFFEPYPLSFRRANGAWLEDVDGHRYVDYLLSFGALMMGHGHPVIQEAVATVFADQGTTAFGVPTPFELELADEIAALYPSCEQVRFSNSGLEATLLAIRLGMAYTGRSHIAKFSGHYHGGHDQVLVSVYPPLAGALTATADSLGLPDYILDHTVVLPFNDISTCTRILREQRDQVGVVIMEPMAAGVIPAEPEFIRSLRDLTRELNMLLIFDEVKTGFRVALGGAQEYYGVSPDLTALGKILGGGFPIGAVGGRRDIMELCSPLRSRHVNEVVFHSGTFNGNPVSVGAGLVTLRALRQDGVFPNLVQRTAEFRRHIEQIGRADGFPVQTIGVGAVFDLLFTEAPIQNYADHALAPKDLRRALDFLLMERGAFSKPLNRFSLSLVHGRRELDLTLSAFQEAFHKLRGMM